MNKRKAKVVREALMLFVEKGIHKTSIQHIIERAGISKGTFYNYFSSKEDCISAIWELAREEARLKRAEISVGKDERSIDVLAQQIIVLHKMNRQTGLDHLIQQILHSDDIQLRNVVIKYRYLELQWVSKRFMTVFQMNDEGQALEASILFFGMLQQTSFVTRYMKQDEFQLEKTVPVLLNYIQGIINLIQKQHTPIVDIHLLSQFISTFSNDVNEQDVLQAIQQLLQQPLQETQQQLLQELTIQIERKPVATVIVDALLPQVLSHFRSSSFEEEAKKLVCQIWYLLHY